MTRPSIRHIDDAKALVTTERDILETERLAFRRFVRRLDDVEPVRATAGTTESLGAGGVRTVAVKQPTTGNRLRQVKTAYSETVMATPHYEDEYGESLEENMAAEFGPDLARQFSNGTTLTPALYQLVRESGTTAIRERSDLLTSITAEHQSLADARQSLTDVQQTLSEIYSRLETDPDSETRDRLDDRLIELENECETVASDRQRRIHNRSGITLSGVDETSLARYLYDEYETLCPVLAVVAEWVDTVQSCRTRCHR